MVRTILPLAIVLAASPALAQPRPSLPHVARLAYTAPEACPDEQVLRDLIGGQTTVEVLALEAKALLTVTVSRSGRLFEASVELSDEAGAVRWTRPFAPASSCADVLQNVALVVSEKLEPHATAVAWPRMASTTCAVTSTPAPATVWTTPVLTLAATMQARTQTTLARVRACLSLAASSGMAPCFCGSVPKARCRRAQSRRRSSDFKRTRGSTPLPACAPRVLAPLLQASALLLSPSPPAPRPATAAQVRRRPSTGRPAGMGLAPRRTASARHLAAPTR